MLVEDVVIVYLHQAWQSKGKIEAWQTNNKRKWGGRVTKEGVKIRNDEPRDEGRNSNALF